MHDEPLPPAPPGPPWQVLLVGGWQRDYVAAARCVSLCSSRAPGLWRFVMIAGRDHADQFKNLPVILLPRLTDEELRDTYRNSHLTLLPLKDATANNALLEAMACGCPVLASAVGGVPDYVSDPAWLVQPASGSDSGHNFADRLEELGRDPARLVQARALARNRALHFRWPEIARQTMDFYREVCPDSNG